MYWSGFWHQTSILYVVWYESTLVLFEIVIAALKSGNMIDENIAASTHPNELYNYIKMKSMADCGRNMTQVKLQFV